MKRKIVSIIIAVAMIATLCVSLTACGTSTVNLNKYMDIKVTGYNGHGVASKDPKEDEFLEDFKNLKLTKAGKEEYPHVTDDGTAQFLYTLIFYNGNFTTPNGSYSNGDEVTYTWKCNDDLVEDVKNAFNLNIEFSDITLTVSGLEDPATFDAFEGVSVTFDGTGPNGSATITADGLLPSSEFTVEPASGLSNGDTVTVSLSNEKASYFIDNYNGVPEEMSRDYIVEGLSGYATKLSQITDEALSEMQAQCEDTIRAGEVDTYHGDYRDLTNITYLGCYFLTPKDGFRSYRNNEIYLVFQVDNILINKNEDGSTYDTPYTYYCVYEFFDAMVSPDGTVSIDCSNYDEPYDVLDETAYDYTLSWWNQEIGLTFFGYSDLDRVFEEIVTKNAEGYNYESSFETNENTDA